MNCTNSGCGCALEEHDKVTKKCYNLKFNGTVYYNCECESYSSSLRKIIIEKIEPIIQKEKEKEEKNDKNRINFARISNKKEQKAEIPELILSAKKAPINESANREESDSRFAVINGITFRKL